MADDPEAGKNEKNAESAAGRIPIRAFPDLRKLRGNYLRSGQAPIAVDSNDTPELDASEEDFGLTRSTQEEALELYRESLEERDHSQAEEFPDWMANVPLKTVGVLCAVNIFGKNIEERWIALTGRRYLHNAMENVVNYALNPILPELRRPSSDSGAILDAESGEALRNIRDCFNYIFHVQTGYFNVLSKLVPGRFVSGKTGRRYNLNQFAGKGPTLINSERRYLVLSTIDGSQPYDLRLDWNADFDWVEDSIRDNFLNRLSQAQEAFAGTLRLGEWYNSRNRNLIIPLRTILNNLGSYFLHLGQAAYHIARNGKRRTDQNIVLIRENLLAAAGRLQRFTLDLLRMNVFSIVKHDIDRLAASHIEAVIKARAEDEFQVGRGVLDKRLEGYDGIFAELCASLGVSEDPPSADPAS